MKLYKLLKNVNDSKIDLFRIKAISEKWVCVDFVQPVFVGALDFEEGGVVEVEHGGHGLVL